MRDKLGNYIERVKEVTPYNKDIPVKGLSINKCFRETHITNLDNIRVPFQLVRKKEFCYSKFIDTNKQLTIALNHQWEILQISCVYVTFKILNEELLNCFYLDLFFKKDLVDRLAKYYATGGVREELSFKDLSRFPICVPELEAQERIVDRYQVVTKYVEVKKRINELLERKMKAYFHLLFDNLEEYTAKSFGELFAIIGGGAPPRSNKELDEKYFCKLGGISWLQTKDITKRKFKFINSTSEQLTIAGVKRGKCRIIPPKTLIFIHNASSSHLGEMYVSDIELTINTNLWAFYSNSYAWGGQQYSFPITFLYFLIKENVWKLKRLINASTTKQAFDYKKFSSFKVKFPSLDLINKFHNFCKPNFELQKNNEQIIQKLLRLQKCWIENLN